MVGVRSKTEEFEFKSIDISIISSCNLKCKHCYLGDLKNANIKLGIDKIKEILIDAHELGAYHLTLTGGEPTLHPNFLEILDFADNLGFMTTIFTNATLVTENLASQIAKHNIEGVQVSLEGLKDHHDYIRGVGTFDKTVSGIKSLVNSGISVTVNTQLTERVLDTLGEYVSFLDSIGVSKLLLTIPASVGDARKNDIYFPDYRLEDLKKIWKLDNPDALKIEPDDKPKKTCNALVGQLAINFDGTVYPCHYFRSLHHYSLGNVYVERLTEIYLSWINSDAELIRYHKHAVPQCNTCQFKNVCKSCAGRIFSLYKSFTGPDLLYCVLMGKEQMSPDMKLSRLVWGRID